MQKTHMLMMHQTTKLKTNTKSVKRGDKLVYQVWLRNATQFDANNKSYIKQLVFLMTTMKLNWILMLQLLKLDSVTSEDVTAKFDIKVENGMITA